MDSGAVPSERPDIVAATRGGDDSLGMEDETDPANASLEQALFWRGIYTEILEMEESVLARIRQLMVHQSPQARREVGVAGLLRGIHTSRHGRRFETAKPLHVDAYPAPGAEPQAAASNL